MLHYVDCALLIQLSGGLMFEIVEGLIIDSLKLITGPFGVFSFFQLETVLV